MCSLGGAVLPVPVQFSRSRRRECCHTLKATRQATQKALAHDARVALPRKVELPVSVRMGPVLTGLVPLRSFSRLAQIRPVSQTDLPGRGPHGGGAGHASVVIRLRLVPEASQFVPKQRVLPEPARWQTPV